MIWDNSDPMATKVAEEPKLLLIILVVLTAIVAGSISRHFAPKYDSREPPVLPQKIPYLGHFFVFLRYGLRYYAALRQTPLFDMHIAVH